MSVIKRHDGDAGQHEAQVLEGTRLRPRDRPIVVDHRHPG